MPSLPTEWSVAPFWIGATAAFPTITFPAPAPGLSIRITELTWTLFDRRGIGVSTGFSLSVYDGIFLIERRILYTNSPAGAVDIEISDEPIDRIISTNTPLIVQMDSNLPANISTIISVKGTIV